MMRFYVNNQFFELGEQKEISGTGTAGGDAGGNTTTEACAASSEEPNA